MFKMILSLFKSGSNPDPASKTALSNAKSQSKKSNPKTKVASTRIGELGEHKINIQLDQLPKDCMSLSDIMIINPKSRTGYTQIDHIVITPLCLFIIETKNYSGEIKGGKKDRQWTVNNRYKMYNPLLQNYGHIKALENLLSSYTPLTFVSIISFTMRSRFGIDPELRKIHSDELVVYDVELSEYISRKLIRLRAENPNTILTLEQINEIHNQIKAANITDPKLRTEHISAIKKGN